MSTHNDQSTVLQIALTDTDRFALLQALGQRRSYLERSIDADPNAPGSWSFQLDRVRSLIASLAYEQGEEVCVYGSHDCTDCSARLAATVLGYGRDAS